jgi:hypothetical protein
LSDCPWSKKYFDQTCFDLDINQVKSPTSEFISILHNQHAHVLVETRQCL